MRGRIPVQLTKLLMELKVISFETFFWFDEVQWLDSFEEKDDES